LAIPRCTWSATARFVPADAKDGRPLPPTAPVAVQQGEYAAERTAAALELTGFVGFLFWRLYYFSQLMG
jgi:hypothetical protein